MELKTILEKRRSVRKFIDRKVEKEKLQRIAEMALTAPSSRNSRSTRLMIVEKPEQLEHIASMRDYGAAFVKNAAAAILVMVATVSKRIKDMGDKSKSDLWLDNCVITATTLQLAVVDEGLASCWVHVNDRPCLKDEPEGKQAIEHLREVLPIPENYGVLCAIALGYSDFEPAPLPPYEGDERILWAE